MLRRCALRLREYIHIACKCGFLSRRSAAGSGALAGRRRQVHASCEAETGRGRKRGSANKSHPFGIHGHKGARRKRLAPVKQRPAVNNYGSHYWTASVATLLLRLPDAIATGAAGLAPMPDGTMQLI